MRFAQSLLFLLVISVANGLPIALNGHSGLIHAIQGDAAAAASETYLKAVASTSVIVAVIRTALPEKIDSTGSSSRHNPSSNIRWNNRTTETSADINNLATDSTATFLEITFTSSAPSSTTLQTISSPHTVISFALVTTLATTTSHRPTLNAPSSSTPTTPNLQQQAIPLYILSCPNTTTTTTMTNNDKIMTQIYQFKLLATVPGALYALVQLCEPQVISKTGHFVSNMVKAI